MHEVTSSFFGDFFYLVQRTTLSWNLIWSDWDNFRSSIIKTFHVPDSTGDIYIENTPLIFNEGRFFECSWEEMMLKKHNTIMEGKVFI